MVEESVDVCDEKNNLTGITKFKSEAHKKGLWHRTAHIWVYNSKGEILIQLRTKDKTTYPDMWDISAAGHVSAGEDPLTSGLRELYEEIGLKVKKNDLKFYRILKDSYKYKSMKNNQFCYVYFLKYDGDISKLKLQKEEVQKIRFLSPKQLEIELKKYPDKYVPNGEYWFEIIHEVERRLNL